MTDMLEVGVRELKAKLSENLARVKAGAVLIVTERGKPIARLSPIAREDIPPHIQALINSGEVRWNGQRPIPFKPIPQRLPPDGKTMADLISEGREDRF